MQYLAPQPSTNIWSANLSRNEHHMINAFSPFSISNVESGSSLFLRKGNKTITFPRVAKKLWLKSNNWKVSLQIPRNQIVMMCSLGESSISDFRKKMGFRPNLLEDGNDASANAGTDNDDLCSLCAEKSVMRRKHWLRLSFPLKSHPCLPLSVLHFLIRVVVMMMGRSLWK